MEKIFEIYIKTTPERLWEAITDSEIRSKYQFGMFDDTRIHGVPSSGVRYAWNSPSACRPRLARSTRKR